MTQILNIYESDGSKLVKAASLWCKQGKILIDFVNETIEINASCQKSSRWYTSRV